VVAVLLALQAAEVLTRDQASADTIDSVNVDAGRRADAGPNAILLTAHLDKAATALPALQALWHVADIRRMRMPTTAPAPQYLLLLLRAASAALTSVAAAPIGYRDGRPPKIQVTVDTAGVPRVARQEATAAVQRVLLQSTLRAARRNGQSRPSEPASTAATAVPAAALLGLLIAMKRELATARGACRPPTAVDSGAHAAPPAPNSASLQGINKLSARVRKLDTDVRHALADMQKQHSADHDGNHDGEK
jgi:hypothetical protein